MDSITNVCRVCLSTSNLKWVFDRKLYCVQEINLRDVIFTITGVEILMEDIISQKICTNCYRTSIKMFQFRMRARKNNKILKDRYNGLIKTSSIEHEVPNPGVTIEKKVEPEMGIKEAKEPNYEIHQSVRDILKKFPRLKLPSPWLLSNIEPCIIVERETVDNFLKEEVKNKQISVSLSNPDQIIAKENTSAGSIATDPLDISTLPIIDTELYSGFDSFNREIIIKNSTFSAIVSDNSNNDDSDYELDYNNTIDPEIRRHTGSEFSSYTRMKDPSSSGPFPKDKPIGLDKSIPLLVCTVCNSVHDNVKKLERHQLRHLRCQFCRSMFKTIRSMETHIKSSCAIKDMMNSPSVKLERIELNQRMRTKYPEAFTDYPLIPGLQLVPRSAKEISDHVLSGKDKKAVDCNVRCANDVIEILSDDDNALPPGNDVSNNTPARKIEIVPVRNTTQSKINSFFLPTNSTAKERVLLTIPSVMATSSLVISTALPVSIIVSATSPSISTHLSSANVVEPDIRINNSTVIDKIDPGLSEIESVKKVLTHSKALKKEGFSQTELSYSTSICMNESDGTIELKRMRNLLVLYRIPFLFTKGDFQARYGDNSVQSKPQQPNELCLWNDLFPVDVKDLSKSSNNEDSVRDRIPVTTSEVAIQSYSPPGFTDDSAATTIEPFNFLFSELPILRKYNRNNLFFTPVNSSSISPNVNVHQQVVSSNSGIVNEDPCSEIPKHILVRTNTSEQQSNNNTMDPSTASYVQICPKGANPEANIADLQRTTVSFFNDLRSPRNVDPFRIPRLVDPTTGPLVSHNFMKNVSNILNTNSTGYHSYNPLAIQNVPDPLSNLVPVTTVSSSNKAGLAFGGIRVKSLRDLT